MPRLIIPIVALLVIAVGATRAGGVATLNVQVSGNGTVTSNPPGISCPPECSDQFQVGDRIRLTANAAPNESFLGWGGVCSGSAPSCMVTADVEKTAAAKFTQGTLPALSIDDVTTQETNFDTVAVLTVTLAPASSETVAVEYGMTDGTADSTDYVEVSGRLIFGPGATAVRIPVTIKGDALDEPDETMFVDLSSPEHATIARGRGTVTILDDPNDSGPPMRILDAAVAATWNVHRSYTRVARLRVTRAPAGAAIEVVCTGKGCPFKRKATGPKVSGLSAAKLRPGTRIQVLVDAPGMIGRVFEYTVRASKVPRVRTLCFLPAASKPGPC